MSEMDVEGSWKGRLWFIFYLWPFMVFGYLKEASWPQTTKDIIILIVMIAASIGWLFMCRRAYRNIKETFRKNE